MDEIKRPFSSPKRLFYRARKMKKDKRIFFRHLGTKSYKEAWDYQTEVFEKLVGLKTANRKLPEAEQIATPGYLLFCEHPHVFTLGKSGDRNNLLIAENILKMRGIDYYPINRGGDITYHGPGQIVGYPIIDLDNYFTDIHKYLRFLEEAVIRTLADYGLSGGRLPGLTGVWLGCETGGNPRKICAIGVKASRWITMHGFAFNVNTDLSYFGMIVPCGITDKAVTSLEKELGRPVPLAETEAKVRRHFAALFEAEIIEE